MIKKMEKEFEEIKNLLDGLNLDNAGVYVLCAERRGNVLDIKHILRGNSFALTAGLAADIKNDSDVAGFVEGASSLVKERGDVDAPLS